MSEQVFTFPTYDLAQSILGQHNRYLHMMLEVISADVVARGDTVVIIAGKDKGKQGKVIAAYPKKDRVVVEGLNQVKRHTKPSQNNPQGGIITKEAPIHVSNVMLVDPESGKPTRVKTVTQADGTKGRTAVKSGKAI